MHTRINDSMRRGFAVVVLGLLAVPGYLAAQPMAEPDLTLGDNDSILLTVFLKHDQTMNNDQRRKLLDDSGFDDMFPPEGVEIVDHYVMMGIGQVIVLKLRPDQLRKVNVAIERGAWGAYQTEFYITYDLREARRATAARLSTEQGR